jgi:glucose/mannose-6-phosphate isomerase
VRAADALVALSSLPEQIREAVSLVRGMEIRSSPDIREVLCCGMGGSGVGADLLAAMMEWSGKLPVVVRKTYGVPAWCGPHTFVVASSYSGETAETLDAFRRARDAGASGFAVAAGGALAAEAEAAGWGVARVRDGLMPRYALGSLAAAPIEYCRRAGWLELDEGWDARIAAALEEDVRLWGPEVAADRNDAKELAAALVGLYPVLWASDPLAAVAAQRWKNDLNENAKIPAHAAVLPELHHNEVVGLAREGADGRPLVPSALIGLATGVEPFVDDEPALDEVEGSFEWSQAFGGAEGDDPLTGFFRLVLLGGYVSVYLADARDVDPVPVDVITRLKLALLSR